MISRNEAPSNNANSNGEGSAIYALGTSETYPFNITNSLFSGNTGKQNTLSMQNSDGNFIDTKFSNNHAQKLTDNIFIGFSEITIQDCEFSDSS